MSSRVAILLLLIASLSVSLGATTSACNGAAKPPPRRPDTPPRDVERARSRTPRPPAPRGPDVSREVTFSLELDGLDRLDRRIIAALPPLFATFARGRALRRFLPAIARSLRLNALALDALDHRRPMAFAWLVTRKGDGSLRIRMLAALPIQGDGKLVLDGIKASYESTHAAPWGGLEIRRNGETVAWVRVRRGWALVAPTAPLLDSAFRHLVPRARKVGAGRVRAHLDAAALTRVVEPMITRRWRKWASNLHRAFGGSRLGTWLTRHRADIERLGTHLASLDSLSLELSVEKQQWRWQLDVLPKKGGALARWIAKQRPGAGFGLQVLPPGAFAAVSDWHAPEVRSLVMRLVSTFTGLQLGRLTDRLPREVAQRGLYRRTRPASYYQYRKILRDLNLADYRTSHQVYLALWHVHAFRRHLKKALPPLLMTATGRMAGALYATPGSGLGLGAVTEISDRRRHARLYQNALWGTLQALNRLAREAWKLMPKTEQKLLGARPPLGFVFLQRAARVGRIPVSAVALRIKWPAKPRGQVTSAQRRVLRTFARYRKLVETVLGPGDLVWAWAYVGQRVLVAAGRDWKPRILGMVRAALGKGGPTLAADPLFAAARTPAAGDERLGLVLFSAPRLLAALLAGLFKIEPRAKRSMALAMLNQLIAQDARQARTGTHLEVLRRQGGYRFQSVLPTVDVRGLLAAVGSVFFGAGVGSMPGSRGPMKGPPTQVTPPHHP